MVSFVRLGGCNLHCRWADTGCDSAFTWDARRYNLREEITPTPAGQVVDFLRRVGTPRWVISGGEPLLHQRRPGVRYLLAVAETDGVAVEVETNGTQVPADDLPGAPWFNVSPKLGNNGADPRSARIVPDALAAFADLARRHRAAFKFVASTATDLDEVAALVDEYEIPGDAVWIMPEGIDPDAIATRAQALADPVLEHRWNLTLRDHRTLWPTEDKGR